MKTEKKVRGLKKDKVCLVLREKKELVVVGGSSSYYKSNNLKRL